MMLAETKVVQEKIRVMGFFFWDVEKWTKGQGVAAMIDGNG
jgi:hypothetical protein